MKLWPRVWCLVFLTHSVYIYRLYDQGLGAKAIRASYPDKNGSLNTLKTICHRIDETGSAVTWIWQSYHFGADFNRMLLQLVGILNTV